MDAKVSNNFNLKKGEDVITGTTSSKDYQIVKNQELHEEKGIPAY